MTNQQGAQEALRPIARYKIGYATDDWGVRSSTPSGIPDPAGAWVRYEDHLAALVEAQQPAPSTAADLIAALEEARSAINSMKVEAETAGQGDEQMMLEACETISNEGLQADMAIRAALASAPRPVPSAARPVTPYTCPKCHALWLHWPAEQTGFGRDTLNCRSTAHCHYCENGGVEQLQRLERVPAVLSAPQPSPTPQADSVLDDAAFEAVRKKLCALLRYSFFFDVQASAVRRVPDKSGSWIAFDDVHALFDPVAVDAALSQAKEGAKPWATT